MKTRQVAPANYRNMFLLSATYLRRGIFLSSWIIWFFFLPLHAQVAIQWQQCLGGSKQDFAHSIQQTADGGYVVAGYTNSNNGDVSGNHGSNDFWVVKLDGSGNIQWQKCLGGTGDDVARSIQQTADGGYVVAGYTYSNNGDVSGNHGSNDFWVVKLDGTGNIQWQKCLGGTFEDDALSIQQTTDGGYVVAGYTWSYNGDVSGNHGSPDCWVVKLDGSGTLQWQKCLGGTLYDAAFSIQQTTDGGYVVAGYSESNNGDVSGNHGSNDFWVVKLDGSGTLQWQKCLGGTGIEMAYTIVQTADGGYVVAGYANSNNGDVSGNHGDFDYWVVKLDGLGTLQWQKCLGGSDDDWASSIRQTADGGYVVAGYSQSNNGDVSGNQGNYDYWVVKLDGSGTLQWQKCLGGTDDDRATSIQQTVDGWFVVTGNASSSDGDVSGNQGTIDFWVVKLTESNTVIFETTLMENRGLPVWPNPATDEITITFSNANLAADALILLRLFDLTGRVLLEKPIAASGNHSITLSLASLSKGMYVVEMEVNGEKQRARFVKWN